MSFKARLTSSTWRERLAWWGAAIAAYIAFVLLYRDPCGPFPDTRSSPYVLPYAVGSSHPLLQASCTTETHRGALKYSYDFSMPVGTTVTAARAGVVAEVRADMRDSQRGADESNWVRIRHDDGTIGSYVHLTEHGALVSVGDAVSAGQPIGLSGNSGNTSRWPHLHFHVRRCASCRTVPVSFRNTDPQPDGLEAGRIYLARPYDSPSYAA